MSGKTIHGSALQPLFDAAGLRPTDIYRVDIGIDGLTFYGYEPDDEGNKFTIGGRRCEDARTAEMVRSFRIDWSDQ